MTARPVNIARALVISQALPCWVSEPVGELAVLDVADQRRAHPVRALGERAWGSGVEGRVWLFGGFELGEELTPGFRREFGPDMADVDEFTIGVVRTEQQRSDAAGRSSFALGSSRTQRLRCCCAAAS